MSSRTWLAIRSERLLWAALLALLLVILGCTRAQYRERADEEAYGAVGQYAQDPRWDLPDYTIQPDPRSRFYSPYDPDRPPMPPDDPTSHRLMHEVDGMRGYRRWHENGDITNVENPYWKEYLPRNEQGNVEVDLRTAVILARLHSRDYQEELEDLYLSALDVTFERFRFDVQYFAGSGPSMELFGREFTGGRTQSLFAVDSDFALRRRFAQGGELVAGLANSLVWNFSGPDRYSASSVLDFALVQPLLRMGSRAVVLERLTRAERTLLANVRQMKRYQHGFFVEIATGVNAPPGPSRGGGVFGSGFEGFTGVGAGGFGQLGAIGGGGGGIGGGGGTGAGQAGGFFGRLQQLQELRNEQANIVSLRSSLEQLESLANSPAPPENAFLQVEQARQALYNAQSRLITRRAAFYDSLDDYKVDLGLPPQLEIELDDSMLEPLRLLHPELDRLRTSVSGTLEQLGGLGANPPRADVSGLLDAGANLEQGIVGHVQLVQQDLEKLKANAPKRRRALQKLQEYPEFSPERFRDTRLDPDAFDKRVVDIEAKFKELSPRLLKTLADLTALQKQAEDLPVNMLRAQLTERLAALSEQLLELSLIQARARLETIVLPPVDLTSDQALDIARVNRLDWMNARASVVDSWRLIEFNANELRSDLNIVVDGELGTTADNPFGFRGENGRLRMSLRFDAPLTRVAERNNYRQALIDYNEAKRSYMRFEDGVSQGLRSTLRAINRNFINFELRRAAIDVAINQVDFARLQFRKPPRPAQANQPGQFARTGATAARDIVSALADLLTAQNDFLSVWINYEVLRMVLERDLGLMRLDPNGVWIDPTDDAEWVPPKCFEEFLLLPELDPSEMTEPANVFDRPVVRAAHTLPWEDVPLEDVPPEPRPSADAPQAEAKLSLPLRIRVLEAWGGADGE